jgi:dTDP-4-dehydrorhamnose reductase
MKVLLVGGSGQAGTEIARVLGDACELMAPSHAVMAMEDSSAVSRVLADFRPDLVINAAGGYDNVAGCETHAARAFQTNVIDRQLFCRQVCDAGARLVTFSTDYVFSGDKPEPYGEDDLPRPIQVYGIVRLAEEHMARSVFDDDAMIIRTCGVYGAAGRRSRGGNFIDRRIDEARDGKVLEISRDQLASPSYAVDIADALKVLLCDLPWDGGVYHIANAGQLSWYDFTRLAFERLGWADRLRPVMRGGLDGAMRRPLNSALASNRARSRGIVMPPVEHALARYLDANYPDLVARAQGQPVS